MIVELAKSSMVIRRFTTTSINTNFQFTTADLPLKIGMMLAADTANPSSITIAANDADLTVATRASFLRAGQEVFIYVDNMNKIFLRTGGSAGTYILKSVGS